MQSGTSEEGVWWLPRRPEERVQGTLTVGASGTLKLLLRGHLEGLAWDPHGVILGETGGGRLASLHQCTVIRDRYFVGVGVILCDYESPLGFYGAHYESPEAVRFTRVRASMPALLDWLVPNDAIEPKYGADGGLFHVGCRNGPLDAEAQVGNFHVVLSASGPEAVSWGGHEMILRQHGRVDLSAPEPISLHHWLQLLRTLQNLLSFGLGRPVDIDGMAGELAPDNDQPGPQRVTIISARLPNTLRHHDPTLLGIPLFTYPDVGHSFESIVRGWFENADVVQPSHDLYFALYHGPFLGDETEFLNLAQALETFHRRLFSGKYMDDDVFQRTIVHAMLTALPDCTPQDLRQALGGRLKFLNSYSLKKRLINLFSELECYPAYFRDRVAKRLATQLTNARNYLTHYDDRNRTAYRIGPPLPLLSWFMRTTLELHLLKLLGFDSEMLGAVFERHGRYSNFSMRVNSLCRGYAEAEND